MSERDSLPRLSDIALIHLHLLMQAQGTTEIVSVKDDCPRCLEIKEALSATP